MRQGWDQLRRDHPPVVAAATRASSLQIVEENFRRGRSHSGRSLLRCNVNTVFDTEICVSCTACVDVCPENLIRLTGLAEVCHTSDGRDWVAGALAITPAELDGYSKEQLNALGGDAQRRATCIRCGLCAARCPSHAITMQRFDFHRMCVTAAGRNPKLNYGPNRTQEGDGQASSQSPGLLRP